MTTSRLPLLALLLSLVLVVPGCTAPDREAEGAETPVRTASADRVDRADVERVLSENLDRILAHANDIEQALRPVPLLTPAQINAFTRFRNPDQLRRAQQFGIPQPASEAAIARHEQEGRLVRLEDNEYWSVRDLDHSVPLATPDAVALLEEIGRRFHARVERLGLPPIRMEVTSVLRTAESQADLRRTNPNAAQESTHLYGTTLDVAYSSFRAPLRPTVDLALGEHGWLEPHLRRIEAAAVESAAARMSRELQAELGHVLREMQGEGAVMVTMEVRQPVYHFTVARRF
jgi:hypothetical protein